MTLQQLLENLPDIEIHGDTSVNIGTLTCDSRKAGAGTLFFALPGTAADGHSYIAKAVTAGATAVVLEKDQFAPDGIPWIKVRDGRAAMGLISSRFNGDPTACRPLIGITGTNGKTTTTYLIEAILAAAGIPAAVLGTISYRFGDRTIAASHTTPESTELQSAFRQLGEAGAKAFVMEVSSHALEQKRVDGCHFDVGVFSNLTRDHLDYHGTMESYLGAKQRLFSELLRPSAEKPLRRAAVNMDDPYGSAIAACSSCPVITYGIRGECDVRPVDTISSVNGISGTLVTPKGSFRFSSKLLGSFNLSNILAAATAGIGLDLPLEAIKSGIENHTTVPGRMERVENLHGVTCLVDYAHTGDALENVLSTLKEIATARIITVFGCGGDRDNGKRPIMGRIAADMSDLAIVTSDNPRTEQPATILSQIRAGILELPPRPQGEGWGEGGVREYSLDELAGGFPEKGFVMQENRREAILLAVRLAKAGDIILLAGKGHEDYQIIGTTKQHFDDREEAAKAFAEKTD
ncbi:MAG: UDP-N-acetylmuramoyl-L-alanyl-D-glutamate--2,6-diaminopimelate ligase [Geobacteraceae bacterium GWC2_55_20]|nr:MAG: UDP-N-acetylmuramoyl-L-alanyl-D-glutamate--2,6-diaminopimelate ligase [Geobacteraceae bacterium GWC2_55_20]OGU26375.1 MAG: UDP-N-acetylmuramoyl-L-alanyl-D-glutamate--2,6-diaminopimelate ligase [Geobacteraceae bacterium GWF2_54_21]HCE69540.1 UDP-N-acetylmuramoyl-L-alanyl-D-glutamate--2,6-diaminopimelate ligase [Geobacter sp.]